MNSPSAELNAYILDYKAQKTLQNSPCYTPVKRSDSSCSKQSKPWLQDVLTVPPELRRRHDYNTPKRSQASPSKCTSVSVTKWLDDLDRKIERRFPAINQTDDNNSNSSNETIELLLADPATGINELQLCASYDSHPNITKLQNTPINDTTFCDCTGHLQAPAWVDDILNDDICDSCIEKTHETRCNDLYKPDKIEQSVELPEGYRLFHSKRSHKKRTSKVRSKSASVSLQQNTNETSETTQNQSPETENIMKLLERAIGQLQEVKEAVEDNTVSAITDSLVSCTTSQALSDLPRD